ncbi:MAG: DNA adenine methylase, partial [Sphaerochaetaceae bacterium]|nr:DNA adenine methylase [Sphaerochaetaceae bacterium]
MALALPRYETNQLISIIGSKRPISDSLRLILSSLTPRRGTPLFLDPFCGSGVVSRLARGMGMAVRAGDTQPFSYLINHVYLSLENDDLNPMLPEMGGLDAYFSLLNMQGLFASESASALARPFLSRYYAPQDDEDYDGKRERLFFTAANARFLDAVREVIETDWIEGRISANEKAVVLASILYEASRKANTSGSFTAYHKSFAGAGNVIRKRIVEPCLLTPPVLPDAEVPRGEMNLCEASKFVKRSSADICYLDPPATVHQYGSTYHLLNTITMWDDFSPSNQRDKEGQLLSKAGIRSDWKQTHSPF